MVGPLYSLVLLGRYPGKDRAVAQSLAREFSRDDAWGLQVIGATPIVILEGLTSEQAQAAREALAEVEQSGSRFEIQQGVDQGLPKVGWPGAPKIRGKTMQELVNTGGTVAMGRGNSATIIVPCPYTGQKMKVTVSVTVEKAAGASAGHLVAVPSAVPTPPAGLPMPVAISIAPQQVPTPRPMGRPSVPVPVPMAQVQQVHSAPVQVHPVPVQVHPVPVQQVHPVAVQVQAAPVAAAAPAQHAADPVILGLDSLEELTPLEPDQPQGRKHAAGSPLPDVPVVGGEPAPAAPREIQPGDMMPNVNAGVPMDLDVFEAGVASGEMHAVSQDEAEEMIPLADDGGQPAPEGDEPLVSLFMGKSQKPEAHQLIAEMHGMDLNAAAKYCQKPIVAVAKDVPESQAQQIKATFQQIGVTLRVTKRK